MTIYTAPVKDMMFLFEKLRNNKNYNEIEKYKEITPELVKDILEEAAKINQNIILPLAKIGDENPTTLDKTLTEDDLYKLELDSFMRLIETKKTQERIKYTLKTGKHLVN